MDLIKLLFDACVSILSFPINVFGFSFSLLNVMVFFLLGILILKILYRLFS